MPNATDLVNVGAAAERFFRNYYAHCVRPDRDTLFSLLEAGHSLNDRLKIGADIDFFDFEEFLALKCLRNYFHHQQELRHVVKLVEIADYPIVTDLAVLCLIHSDIVEAAIQEVPVKHRPKTRTAYQAVFHWYGSIVNINPSIFNFVVLAYERLKDRGIPLTGDAVERFEASYHYEKENDMSHLVDGMLATSVGSISKLLIDISNTKGL